MAARKRPKDSLAVWVDVTFSLHMYEHRKKDGQRLAERLEREFVKKLEPYQLDEIEVEVRVVPEA